MLLSSGEVLLITDDSSAGREGIRLIRALDVLDNVLPSLQRLAVEYGIEAWDPDRITHIIEKVRKTDGIPFEEAKDLYFCISVAVARSDDWKLTGETVGALLEVRDAVKVSMRTAAETEGKSAEFDNAERVHQQYLVDFHSPGAPFRRFFGPQARERGAILRTVLKDPATTARAIQAMERHGLDASDIKRLAEKYTNTDKLERVIRDAALLEVLGVKEFSRREVAATRRAAARWAIKAVCYLGVALLLLWIVLHVGRSR